MTLNLDPSIVGTEFDRTEHAPVAEAEIREYIEACGEVPRPAPHATEVIAPPTFVVRMRGKRFVPGTLADLGLTGFDAGKEIEFGVPIRPGDVLTSVSTIHDIYEKTGRTGSMGFVVLRTTVTNHRDQMVATIDQKMMFR